MVKNKFVVIPIAGGGGVENGAKPKAKTAHEVVASARAAFETGASRPLQFRRDQLNKLLRMLEQNRDAFVGALKQDLGRPEHESLLYDVDLCANDIRHTLNNLDDWAKPTYPPKPLAFTADVLKIVNDPYGVVLILGCWNFPLTLLLTPLAAAISGGNCAVVKPSEIAAATAELVATLLPKYLDPNCYQMYAGGPEETATLLEQRFDYIFFTGSTKVGQIVHAAANKYLTPVTLEMGGKSPVYIDDSADLDMTAVRVLWGKCTNAGQTCIAPDYVLCSEEVQKRFVTIAKRVLKDWYGDDAKKSPSYGRIINDVHYNRLVGYLDDEKHIALGGRVDAQQRFVEPTVLTNVSPNHPVMLEEIFGPILPIVIVKSAREAVAFVNAREKPLALYVFARDESVKDLFLGKTCSGTVAVNDTIVQFGVITLPFGGVGASGMGSYHGKHSFDTFVHKKSVVEKSFNPLFEKINSIRYPPYTSGKTSCVQTVLRTRQGMRCDWLKYLIAFCLGCVFIICVHVIYKHVTAQTLF